MQWQPYIRYKVDDTVLETRDINSAHFSGEVEINADCLRVSLTPKQTIEILECYWETPYPYQPDEWFFVNGYQSWTTSREYRRQDMQRSIIPLANMSRATKQLASISGDSMFTRYRKQPGYFHSFTYTYLRRGADVTLLGSRSERNGYTLFYADMQKNLLRIEKDVAGLIIDDTYELFDIVVHAGSYDTVFDQYFSGLQLRKPNTTHLSGYTSWYNYFQKIDENIILRDLNGLDRAQESVSIFQIDDGYAPAVGDWLDPNPKDFPRGMKVIADKIHEKGYLAGIWLAPFNAQKSSRIRKAHPDWLIRDEKTGKPLLGCVGWGGADTFDVYHPEFRAHIKQVFDVVLHEWGYDMVKLDFLYSQAMQPRNGKTRGTIMCEAMDFLRECVGDKLLLGCGVPLGPSFGVVDACRISCDVDLVYAGKFYNKLHVNPEIPSAQNAINNSIFRRHLDGRVFCNDPDVFFLRENNLTFTKEQKLLLGQVNHMFGNVLFVSDNAGEYSEEDVAYLRRFFTKHNCQIKLAEYTAPDEITITYTEDGCEKTLCFQLSTGKGNVMQLLQQEVD